MKFLLAGFVLYFSIFSISLVSQEKEIREDMVVINVEVPIRVMHKGKPVDNLKKSDFKLFENGKELPINGFHIVRKKISSKKIKMDSERTQYYEPRFFVLAFSVTNFNKFYEKGVRYFFDNVLRKEDMLLVFVNNATLAYNDLNEKETKLETIIKALNKEGKKARRNLRFASMVVESGVRNLVTKLSSLSRRGGRSVAESEVLSFFQQYNSEWEKFKQNYLTLDIYTLYNFATFLKKVTAEKWVISFYQYEKFPVIDFRSVPGQRISLYMGRESQRIIKDIYREFNAAQTFPYEEVSKMFYNLGAIFNLVVIPTRIETDSESTKTKTLTTAAEITLREITKRTGGSISFSTDITKSIGKIIDKEDISYILTYAPEETSRRGKLKIKLVNKKYKLLFDNNQRADFIKRKLKKYLEREKIVKLENLQFIDKKLVFKLINFELKTQKKKSSGLLNVNLIIKDNSGKIIFDEKKIINPKKGLTEIAITFNWLTPGKYDLILDVKDLLSNHKAFEYIKLEVK